MTPPFCRINHNVAFKAKNRMFEVKATMRTMSNQISQQAAMLKVAGTMSKSAELMNSLNSLMSSSKLSAGMHVLAEEMMKAGVVEAVLEGGFDADEFEQEADFEVDDVLMELLPDMPDAPWKSIPDPPLLPAGAAANVGAAAIANPPSLHASLPGAATSDRANEDPNMEALQARAGAL